MIIFRQLLEFLDEVPLHFRVPADIPDEEGQSHRGGVTTGDDVSLRRVDDLFERQIFLFFTLEEPSKERRDRLVRILLDESPIPSQ